LKYKNKIVYYKGYLYNFFQEVFRLRISILILKRTERFTDTAHPT